MIGLSLRPWPDLIAFERQRQEGSQGNWPCTTPVEHLQNELAELLLNLGVSHLDQEVMVFNLDFSHIHMFKHTCACSHTNKKVNNWLTKLSQSSFTHSNIHSFIHLFIMVELEIRASESSSTEPHPAQLFSTLLFCFPTNAVWASQLGFLDSGLGAVSFLNPFVFPVLLTLLD